MRKMKKVLSLVLSLVLVCGIVAGFAACSGNKENNKKEDTTAQSDLAKIQAAGVLKVGSTEYKPMNYKDKNDEWTGFDTEFAQALGEKLGVKVKFVEINWNNKYNPNPEIPIYHAAVCSGSFHILFFLDALSRFLRRKSCNAFPITSSFARRRMSSSN